MLWRYICGGRVSVLKSCRSLWTHIWVSKLFYIRYYNSNKPSSSQNILSKKIKKIKYCCFDCCVKFVTWRHNKTVWRNIFQNMFKKNIYSSLQWYLTILISKLHCLYRKLCSTIIKIVGTQVHSVGMILSFLLLNLGVHLMLGLKIKGIKIIIPQYQF
jgi:hypothetical protein